MARDLIIDLYPVAHTRLDIPRPLFTHSWTTGGKSRCSRQGGFEPPTCRSTVEHANHQTTMTVPGRRIFSILGDRLRKQPHHNQFMPLVGLCHPYIFFSLRYGNTGFCAGPLSGVSLGPIGERGIMTSVDRQVAARATVIIAEHLQLGVQVGLYHSLKLRTFNLMCTCSNRQAFSSLGYCKLRKEPF